MDYSKRTSSPLLRERVLGNDESTGSSFVVNEVVGAVDGARLQDTLEKKCGAQSTELDASCMSLKVDSGRSRGIIKSNKGCSWHGYDALR